MLYLGGDDLIFDSMETTENMTHYVPGGYHPLIIGNIVQSPTSQSSYRILHKLGYGSYATVWLAEKVNAFQQYVALKVTTAEGTPTNEAKFMGSISSPHISPLIDAFTLEGPNGMHSVIITEVLVPLLSYLGPSRSAWSSKKIAYDLARAVADLHQSGCVHGDLHLGNAGISVPQIASQKLHDVMTDLDYPQPIVVLPNDVQKATLSLPAYVVPPCNMAKYYNHIVGKDVALDPKAKLFDFGNAHAIGEIPAKLQCALEACSPEIAFAVTVENIESPPVEPPSDVWALGAMIYEMMFGPPLYGRTGIRGFLIKASLMATDPPSSWDERCPPVADTDNWWNERRDTLRERCSSDADTDALIRLLRRIFILDPLKRPSAAEVCQDDWFKEVTEVANADSS